MPLQQRHHDNYLRMRTLHKIDFKIKHAERERGTYASNAVLLISRSFEQRGISRGRVVG